MNRMIYDDCAFRTRVRQSITPMQYVMDPIQFEHCGKCRPELGIVGGTAVSHVNGNLVDLENNLLGIDRPATHCPQYKFLPTPPGAPLQGKEYIKPVCHPKIDTTMSHLAKCQFSSYPAIPQPQPMQPFRCPR
jgi:hypothetical protein